MYRTYVIYMYDISNTYHCRHTNYFWVYPSLYIYILPLWLLTDPVDSLGTLIDRLWNYLAIQKARQECNSCAGSVARSLLQVGLRSSSWGWTQHELRLRRFRGFRHIVSSCSLRLNCRRSVREEHLGPPKATTKWKVLKSATWCGSAMANFEDKWAASSTKQRQRQQQQQQRQFLTFAKFEMSGEASEAALDEGSISTGWATVADDGAEWSLSWSRTWSWSPTKCYG